MNQEFDFSLRELVVKICQHTTVKHFLKMIKINLLNPIIIIPKLSVKPLEIKLAEMAKQTHNFSINARN